MQHVRENEHKLDNEGFIDLHSHILPGIDDGSHSPEESLQMLRECTRQGVKAMIATPHFYAEQNTPERFLERRTAAYERLTRAQVTVAEQSDFPQLFCAAEVAYFTNMSNCADLSLLCVENTNVLLLEMPFCEWNDFQVDEVMALISDYGYRIILVHPERFCFSRKNYHMLEQLAEAPIALQVNAGSLLHWRSCGLALKLLQMTRTPLLGSDCHNLTKRPPNLKAGRNVIYKKLGAEFLYKMDENAEEIILMAKIGKQNDGGQHGDVSKGVQR